MARETHDVEPGHLRSSLLLSRAYLASLMVGLEDELLPRWEESIGYYRDALGVVHMQEVVGYNAVRCVVQGECFCPDR